MVATPMPTRVDPVYLYRGDTFTFPSYTFVQADKVTPIDLTGYAWAAQWRPSPDSVTAITIDLDLTGASAGRIVPSISSANSTLLEANGVWDLQSTLAGVVRTWVYGPVATRADVTHA